MSSKLTIRKIHKDDLPNVLEVIQITFQETYASESLGIPKQLLSAKHFYTSSMIEFYHAVLLGKNRMTYVAILQTKIVGVITVVTSKKVTEIENFYVLPQHQGKGIGKLLWRTATKNLSTKRLSVKVISHAKKTQSMYKSWGFRSSLIKYYQPIRWDTWPENVRMYTIEMHKKYAPQR